MRRAVCIPIAVVSLLAGPSAQGSPDISGFWELSFDSRRVPAADLAQAVTPAVLAKQAERDAHAIRWCNFLGLPLSMDSPRPINIRQGRREIVINFETVATPRHLYFRPAHANMEIFDPTRYWRLDRPLGGRHAGCGHSRVRRCEGCDDDSRRRLSHIGLTSRRALSLVEWRHGAVGHIHLGRSEGVSHAAHLRVPLPPCAATVRGTAAAAVQPVRRGAGGFPGLREVRSRK